MFDLITLLRESNTKNVTLDSTTAKNKPEPETALDSAANYELANISQQAVGALHQWAESDDLDSGETAADRLISLMVGIADSNQDGELDEDESEIVTTALEAAWDYLSSMGASDDDISALLNDWDESAASNLLDLVATSLPDGDDEADARIAAFAFGDEDQDSVFDATYAKRLVVRGGKKMRVNKRIGGVVRLSAKQKVAIKKMQKKSHSAKARVHRLRSMKVRAKMNV